MQTVNEYTDSTLQSLQAMWDKVLTALPNIIGAIVILLLGWIITKIVVYLVKKILKLIRVEKLTAKLNELKIFGDSKIKFSITKVITVFIKWGLFLVFLIIAADIMNWQEVSKEIGNLLRYLPRLFSAIAIFMVGMYIARFVKRAIEGVYESFDLAGAKIISTLVFYVIAVIVTITSLNQAGIDTTVVTNNVTIILGAFLLAIAIGFGFGSREIIADLLHTFYTRKNYEVGDTIKINGAEGDIESIDNVCMTLKTATGRLVIPIKEVAGNRVEIVRKS